MAFHLISGKKTVYGNVQEVANLSILSLIF